MSPGFQNLQQLKYCARTVVINNRKHVDHIGSFSNHEVLSRKEEEEESASNLMPS